MNRHSCLIIGLILAGFFSFADEADKVRLDLFSTRGCPDCERIEKQVIPEIEETCEGLYTLVRHDMGSPETIPLLLAYAERCGTELEGTVSIVIDHSRFLTGSEMISTGLLNEVNEALVRRQVPGWELPSPPIPKNPDTLGKSVQINRLTLPVIILGGFLDGINPCAISTLIFFLSLLAIAHTSRVSRLGMGIAFITSSFLIYLALGLGFLTAFKTLPLFPVIRRIVEILLAFVLVILAILSFRDAIRFKREGAAEAVTLKLPPKIKAMINQWMQTKIGIGGPVLGGLIAGAGATLLESVCTGQGYLPILSYLWKQGFAPEKSFCLLVIYNLFFIFPLAIVLFVFHKGTTIPALIRFSRNHLPFVKSLMALFFILMAILILCP